MATLRDVAEGNALGLSVAIDHYCSVVTLEYERLAPDALDLGIATRLEAAIAGVVHEARGWGHAHGAGDVLDELKAIAPGANLNLSASGMPQRSDVAEYVRSAAKEALDAASAAKESDYKQAFVAKSYRAEVLIEDQTVREYERAKTAAYHDLERLDDNPKRGFVVARAENQLRSEEKQSAVAIVAKRRSEINDARTCETCRAQDGQLRLLGMEFSTPIPAHPRCRGISHLWAVGWPWGAKAMDETLTRWVTTVDVREIQVDETNRTIRNVVVSDESLDSHDSIIRSSGWDLSRYAKNPVLLWAHKGSRSFDAPRPDDVLGTTSARVEADRLVADLVFSAKGINPQADMVFEQMKAKIIRAMSVGFRGLEYHFEQREGGEILIIDRALLVEVSVLPVGSNENALARHYRACRCGEESNMDTGKTKEVGATLLTVALPPEIASVTGTATVEGAVRKYEDAATKLAELELKLDKATKDAEAASTRAVAAEKALTERVERDTASEIEALIKAGRISESKRAFALKLARTDIDAFRGMYPVEEGAPLQPILKQIVASSPTKDAPAETRGTNPIETRANELMKSGMNYVAAWSQACVEHKPA